MASLNKVMLIGHLGKDPEVKTLENGNKVAKVSLATTERYKDKAGIVQESTEWHNLEMWGDQAKLAEQYLRKGKFVYVEGKIKTDSWEDHGIKKFWTSIRVYNFTMLGGVNENKPQTSGEATTVSTPNPDDFVNTNSVDDLPF
jgi:single-strand DNA-binding protein